MKRLDIRNGDVQDAGQQPCRECDASLPQAFDYCPYCGDEL